MVEDGRRRRRARGGDRETSHAATVVTAGSAAYTHTPAHMFVILCICAYLSDLLLQKAQGETTATGPVGTASWPVPVSSDAKLNVLSVLHEVLMKVKKTSKQGPFHIGWKDLLHKVARQPAICILALCVSGCL